MNRRAAIRLLLLLAILAALAGLAFAPPKAPPTQPPLETLTAENLPAFHSTFNDAAGKVRVILLFSPT
jgi:hypothetical protein